MQNVRKQKFRIISKNNYHINGTSSIWSKKKEETWSSISRLQPASGDGWRWSWFVYLQEHELNSDKPQTNERLSSRNLFSQCFLYSNRINPIGRSSILWWILHLFEFDLSLKKKKIELLEKAMFCLDAKSKAHCMHCTCFRFHLKNTRREREEMEFQMTSNDKKNFV